MANPYWLLAAAVAMIGATPIVAAQPPCDPHHRFFELSGFRLESGVVLPKAKIADAMFGTLNTTLRPIPSLWGHSAGSGGNPDDNRFISGSIRDFLR